MKMRTAFILYALLTIASVIALIIVNSHDLAVLLSLTISLATNAITVAYVFTNKLKSHTEN